MIINEIDLGIIQSDRRRMNTYHTQDSTDYVRVKYSISKNFKLKEYELVRRIDPSPFVLNDNNELNERCRDIFTISYGIKGKT